MTKGLTLAEATVTIDLLGITATSDGGGVAILNNVSVGTWIVTATATGKISMSLTVTIQPNTTVTANFNLTD